MEDLKPITNEDRRLAITNYIKEHQECSISDVVRYMTNVELASKRTVEKIIDELVDENAIKKEKPRKNSKIRKLSTISENPLTYLPIQLEELHGLFKKLTDSLVQIYSQESYKWPIQESSVSKSTIMIPSVFSQTNVVKEVSVMLNVILVPFVLIDLIHAPFQYLQRTLWINYNRDLYHRISHLLFLRMDELNQMALEVLRKVYKDKYKMPSIHKNELYFVTIENTYMKFSVVEKICLLRHTCKALQILPEIESILEYLIENNLEYFSGYDPFISPHFVNICKSPYSRYVDIIHEGNCPARLHTDEYHCDSLDKDPSLIFI